MKIEGHGMKVTKHDKKPLGDNRKTRVCPYFEKPLLKKLKRISKAIDKSPPETLLEIAEVFLNHPEWVKYIQRKHLVDPDDPLYVQPKIENGQVIY
ncbi:hypothetical protein [Ammoniphilus resinae]|uniref:Uncharacterized protein n=1 Tax=Ammoniphilus resinae TaxID=861532 RepID=A0ABS4GNE2_9BACL|nr:hypothetical protein [Ammoniphilus resinae]MBP1931802.1 hypothetical protein [Ammoniphilus resinae]